MSEGAIKADKIAALAREAAMPAVAITDSGNLFGALEFSQSCTLRGVQPIIGCQIPLTRADNPRLPSEPVVLLAQNAEGLAYEQSDYGNDGTHPSPAGQKKVAEHMLKFFKADATTKPWFVRPTKE